MKEGLLNKATIWVALAMCTGFFIWVHSSAPEEMSLWDSLIGQRWWNTLAFPLAGLWTVVMIMRASKSDNAPMVYIILLMIGVVFFVCAFPYLGDHLSGTDATAYPTPFPSLTPHDFSQSIGGGR